MDVPIPSPPEEAPCLYTAALDAGDRLVTALGSGDLGGAARVLGERRQIIESIQSRQSLAAPSPDLVERFKVQDEHLNGVLRHRMTTLGDAVSTTGRAALARDRYASSSGGPPSVLDTAPRRA